MSIKTVTIHWYPLFQANGWASRAIYRGHLLHETIHADKRECQNQTEVVCKALGFTHAKICEQNGWNKQTIYTVKLK